MGRVATRSGMTADEYLAWEREQLDKHEFFDGEVYAMAGGSPRHNALSTNVLTALNIALRTRGCSVLTSDQRVRARLANRASHRALPAQHARKMRVWSRPKQGGRSC